MRHMDQDAATLSSTLPDRLTRSFAGTDGHVNRVHDALNARLPRLWWPLDVPKTWNRLGAAEHALYAAHATIGLSIVVGLTRPRVRRHAGAITVVAAVVSWAMFTGAWDRRADSQAESSARRTL